MKMEPNEFLAAESLIPHRRGMRLIEWVKNPTPDALQAETVVTEKWPLQADGMVSSLLGMELVAQTVSALSTWRRGEGAGPKVGLVVGIKESEFLRPQVPVGTRLTIQIQKLYQIGDYAVVQGEVRSDSALICKIILQVMEPEAEVLQASRANGR
jgi:predicted hotdog family 3-hydroxylacyl-ACP dehydratase